MPKEQEVQSLRHLIDEAPVNGQLIIEEEGDLQRLGQVVLFNGGTDFLIQTT